jgi:hypothetical protein
MLLRYFLLFVALYVAYKLVFEFAIPLFRTYRQIRRQFRGMSDHLHQQAKPNGGQDAHGQPRKPTPEKKPEAGDYIDFEEIK